MLRFFSNSRRAGSQDAAMRQRFRRPRSPRENTRKHPPTSSSYPLLRRQRRERRLDLQADLLEKDGCSVSKGGGGGSEVGARMVKKLRQTPANW